MNQSIKVALQMGSNIGTISFRRTEAHLHHPLGCRSIYKFRNSKKNTPHTRAQWSGYTSPVHAILPNLHRKTLMYTTTASVAECCIL